MNRGQIKLEIADKIKRDDSTTINLLEQWIGRVIREVEKTYPYLYLRRPAEPIRLSPDNNVYSLPFDLILHHPFILKLVSPNNEGVFSPLIKVGNDVFENLFVDRVSNSTTPLFFVLQGGSESLDFEIFPGTEEQKTLEFYAYFYTNYSSWNDKSSNWLTETHPDLIIYGVLSKAYEHFNNPQEATMAKVEYMRYLNGNPFNDGVMGIIQQEKTKKWSDRNLRIKDFRDDPNFLRKNIFGR